jgi:hypothetical protein
LYRLPFEPMRFNRNIPFPAPAFPNNKGQRHFFQLEHPVVRKTLAGLMLAAALLCGGSLSSRAEELVWATGKVVEPSGKPMTGAVVAVYDDTNKVVDYARTDQRGEYALAVPKHLLHLERKHGKGFIAEVFTSATRFVSGAAGFVANPLRAGLHAVTNSQVDSFADPLTKGEIAAGGAVVDQVLFAVSPHQKRKVPLEERKQPGVLMIKVIAPNRNDLVSISRVYWLEEETLKMGGRQKKTLAAWLDPVNMASADLEEPSKIDSSYLRFTNTRIEPSLAEVGQTVHITTRLPMPPDPQINLVVVARNNRTGQKWELERDNDGYFTADIQIDKRFPHDDQIISLVAYAADEQHPGRRPRAEGALEKAGFWDPAKPYIYDPLLVVSRNRAEVTLTVVAPNKRRPQR